MEVSLDIGRILVLKEFVSHLTQVMHSSVSGSLVIWYDRDTIEGQFDWQNQLNEHNKPFLICVVVYLRTIPGRKIIQSSQLLLLVIGSLMSTWESMFLVGALLVMDNGRWWSLVEKSWGILQSYPKVLPF